jgi:hypothetical protein
MEDERQALGRFQGKGECRTRPEMKSRSIQIAVALALIIATAGIASARHDVTFDDAEDGYVGGLKGPDLLVFLLVVIWLVQLSLAPAVRMDAGRRWMSANRWLILVIIPIIGPIFITAYLILRWNENRNHDPVGRRDDASKEKSATPRRSGTGEGG